MSADGVGVQLVEDLFQASSDSTTPIQGPSSFSGAFHSRSTSLQMLARTQAGDSSNDVLWHLSTEAADYVL